MKKKTFVWITVIGFYIFIFLIAGITIYIDPLFQYHKRVEGYYYPITNERYQNPGIVKTFSYNTLITGSSLMQNNKTEWWNAYISSDMNAIKVPYPGATAKNTGMIMRMAIENNPDLENIYAGCDVHLWGKTGTSDVLPMYLYDDCYWNDYRYFLNGDLIFSYTLPVLFNLDGLSENTSMSDAFGKPPADDAVSGDVVLAEYREVFAQLRDEGGSEEYTQQMKRNVEEYILPVIEKHPNVHFHFIFPPYHAMYWEMFEARNVKDGMFECEEYLLRAFTAYDNVTVHFFSSEESIIYDFDNYNDVIHYKPRINEYMVQCIGREDHVIGQNDIPAVMEKLIKMTEEYDYRLVLQ